MRPFVSLAAAALLIGVVAFLILRPDPLSAEEQVRQTMRDAVAAVEAKELGTLVGFISDRFKGHGMDRGQLKGLLFVQLRRGSWRKVFLVDTDIEMDADNKGARVRTGAVLATGGEVTSVNDVLPTDAGSYRFDLRMELEQDDAWRVTSVKYENAALKGLIGGP